MLGFCMKLFYFLEGNFECLHLSRIAYPSYVRSLLLEGIVLISVCFAGHSSEKTDFIAVLLAQGIAHVTGYAAIEILTEVFGSIISFENTRTGFNRIWTEHMNKYLAVSWLAGLAISAVWFNGWNISILLSQEPAVAYKVDTYLSIYTAVLPILPILKGSLKLLDATNSNQTVSIIILFSANCLEILLCYLLANRTHLGVIGLALSPVVAYYIAGLLILAYILCTRVTMQVFYTNRWAWLFNWSTYVTSGARKAARVFSDILIYHIGIFIVATAGEERYVNIGSYGVLLYLNVFVCLWGRAMEYGIANRLRVILQNRFFSDARNTLVTSIIWCLATSLIQSLFLVATADLLGWVFSGDMHIVQRAGALVYLLAILSFCMAIQESIRGQKVGWESGEENCLLTVCSFVFGLVLAVLLSQLLIGGVKGYWVGLTVWGIFILLFVTIRILFLYTKWFQQLHYTTPLPTMSPSNVIREQECTIEASYSYDRESAMFKSFRVESLNSNSTTPPLEAGSSIVSSIEVNERTNLHRATVERPWMQGCSLKWVVFKRIMLTLLLVTVVIVVVVCKFIHQHFEVTVSTNFTAPVTFCCVNFASRY